MRFRDLRLPWLALVTLAAGCGHESVTAPLVPVAPSAASSFSEIIGHVMDTAFRPIAGVTIEIMDGNGAGRSVLSDASGTFVFNGGPFVDGIAFRATRDGFIAQTFSGALMSLSPGWRAGLLVTLESTVAPVRIAAGDYVMTLTADQACTQLPEEIRTRRFPSIISASSNTRYTVRGRGLVSGLDQVVIGVAGHDLHFEIEDGLYEQTAPGATLRFFGVGDARVDDPMVFWPLEFTVAGLIDFCSSRRPIHPSACGGPSDPPVFVKCSAPGHRLILTPRYSAVTGRTASLGAP